MPTGTPDAIDRAWAALMAGDMDTVLQEMRFVDGAWRALGGLALLLKQRLGGKVNRWMDVPQVQLGGLSPREYLRRDNPVTWQAVIRTLNSDERREIARAISDVEHALSERDESAAKGN